jgi:hypothetical protein
VTIKFVPIVLISQAKIRKISKSKVSLAYILTYIRYQYDTRSIRISLSIEYRNTRIIYERVYHCVSYEYAYHMNARTYEYAYHTNTHNKQILGRYKRRYIYARIIIRVLIPIHAGILYIRAQTLKAKLITLYSKNFYSN